jgi:hypothetical protein
MRKHESVTSVYYYTDLVVATSIRLILLLSIVALMGTLAACKNGGDLDLTLKGSAAAPPIKEVGKVN